MLLLDTKKAVWDVLNVALLFQVSFVLSKDETDFMFLKLNMG